MFEFLNSRIYILLKSIRDLDKAKKNSLCRYIIYEENNIMYVWERFGLKWVKKRYILYKDYVEKSIETKGIVAYQKFYNYCGKEEINKMKNKLPIIPKWDSYEQLHYSNYEFAQQKLYKPIYEYDVNSSFTYGAMQLPSDFNKLKDYMLDLYEKKKNATTKLDRSLYKNLQNYLVGYFAKIKEFVKLRSDIIFNSNFNVKAKMAEIVANKGTVYLSNTDSIITDEIGAEVLEKYRGNEIGQFKLEAKVDKLFYNSSNSYQIGNKVVYSGVKYFERINTDFFEGITATQTGDFLKDYDFICSAEEDEATELCKIKYEDVRVLVYNNLGELTDVKIYKVDDGEDNEIY